jgi:hypothetical protein
MRIAHPPKGPPQVAPSLHSRSRNASGSTPFAAVLAERVGAQPSTAQAPKAASPVAAPPAATPAKATPVRAMLERMVGAENQVDKLLHAAATGKTFSPAELLALQSTVFRYSQTVEVVSRVADRMVGAIKQTLGTNV